MKPSTTRNISKWYDLPGTDGNTQWVKLEETKKLQQEITHLKTQLRNEYDKPCIHCGSKIKYSEKFDSYYCPKCLYWIEKVCPDRECSFCKYKPKYPKENQE